VHQPFLNHSFQYSFRFLSTNIVNSFYIQFVTSFQQNFDLNSLNKPSILFETAQKSRFLNFYVLEACHFSQ